MKVEPGQTFGRLTLLAPSIPKGKKRYWLCRCECGVEKAAQEGNLKSGAVASCGCLKREMMREKQMTHGGVGTRAYEAWSGMRKRCHNKNCRSYKDYGGRGISICARWEEFENFIADMGEPPPGLTLDRIDNDADYSPTNCRWATKKEQARNQRHVVWLEHRGQRRRLVEWAEDLGIPYYLAYQRMKAGFPSSKVLATEDMRYSDR